MPRVAISPALSTDSALNETDPAFSPLSSAPSSLPPQTPQFDIVPQSTPHQRSIHVYGQDNDAGTVLRKDSYNIEHYRDIKQLHPDWRHDEIEEIVVISPRRHQDDGSSSQIPKIHDYILLNTLGQGASATVFLAHSVSSDSPGMRAIKSFVDEGRLVLVTEFCPGGDLLTHVMRSGAFSADRSRFYACELVVTLSTLCRLGIAHRDLKPENVLIDAWGHIVVTDFGSAKQIAVPLLNSAEDQLSYITTTENSSVGTPEYQAPEVILGWPHDYAVDVWGFGLLLYLMIYGKHPFMLSQTHEAVDVLRERIISYPVPFPRVEHEDEVAKDLILNCLERNTGMRIHLEGIREHEYFDRIDWDRVEAKAYEVPWSLDLDERKDALDLRYFEKEFCDMDVHTELERLQQAATTADPEDAFDAQTMTWTSDTDQLSEDGGVVVPTNHFLQSPSLSAFGTSMRESTPLSDVGHTSGELDVASFEPLNSGKWLERGLGVTSPGYTLDVPESRVQSMPSPVDGFEDFLRLDRNSLFLSPAPSLGLSILGDTPTKPGPVPTSSKGSREGAALSIRDLYRSPSLIGGEDDRDDTRGPLDTFRSIAGLPTHFSASRSSAIGVDDHALPAAATLSLPGIERIGRGIGFTPKKVAVGGAKHTPSSKLGRLVQTPKKLLNRLRGSTPYPHSGSSKIRGTHNQNGRRSLPLEDPSGDSETSGDDMLAWGVLGGGRAFAGVDETPARPARGHARFPRLSLPFKTPRRSVNGALDGTDDPQSSVRLVSVPRFRSPM
ncbi:kinase-like protein [Punctularia strigosozonata HHB-11173 SS5]|uniref:kinase-like protein n=1 Tax=Punctularia strigosozonata (strain HHB-11173) TaxID=741275 RepID=UPI000441728B|nr:kinase-like protein [Punctularia strigosozonata HHB-11173 SS5]EIN13296.1 kinase-like protein [Punctularia strigosozonata HHB-11173 SS5]